MSRNLRRIYWIGDEKNSGGYPPELPVRALLRDRGIEVVPIVWDRDPVPDPGEGELAIVRTPWDYVEKIDRFDLWISELPRERIQNPAEILGWNLDKTYLRELSRSGVETVPTEWMDAKSAEAVAESIDRAFPGKTKIVKPVRSAGAHLTFRLSPGERPPPGSFVSVPAMIQPYLPEIESDGERSLVYFGGEFSHSIRKVPRSGDFRVQESFGGKFSEFSPSGKEREFGDSALSAVRSRFPGFPPPLYARVDYVRVGEKPRLMELELLEPDLYFHHSPGSAERFVASLFKSSGP